MVDVIASVGVGRWSCRSSWRLHSGRLDTLPKTDSWPALVTRARGAGDHARRERAVASTNGIVHKPHKTVPTSNLESSVTRGTRFSPAGIPHSFYGRTVGRRVYS